MADIYRTEVPGGVLFIPIETGASGTLIFGVASRAIVVLSVSLVASDIVNAKFQTFTGSVDQNRPSDIVNAKFQTFTGSVDLTGPYYCAKNGGIVLPFNAGGWFRTLVGDSLLINLSSGIAVGGSLSYILV